MNTFNEADRRKILESLTADELATFQEAFTVFDKNQDGTITTKVRLYFFNYLNFHSSPLMYELIDRKVHLPETIRSDKQLFMTVTLHSTENLNKTKKNIEKSHPGILGNIKLCINYRKSACKAKSSKNDIILL